MKNINYTLSESLVKKPVMVTDTQIPIDIEAHLPELEDEINKVLGGKHINFNFRLEEDKDRYGDKKYSIVSDENLVKYLGDNLVKTMFTDVKLTFWGGSRTKDEEIKIWFKPQLNYNLLGAGSNGCNFIWPSIWFDFDNQTWIYANTYLK